MYAIRCQKTGMIWNGAEFVGLCNTDDVHWFTNWITASEKSLKVGHHCEVVSAVALLKEALKK